MKIPTTNRPKTSVRLQPRDASRIPGYDVQETTILALEQANFEGKMRVLYDEAVLHTTNGHTTVNLACLHRVTLHRLQRQLVLDALKFKYDPASGTEEYRVHIQEYGTYITNLKYHFEFCNP